MTLRHLDSYEPPATCWSDWRGCQPVLARYDFAGLRHALLDPATASVHKDVVLAALLRIGQHQADWHATMTVVVCLLPGLRGLARRYRDLLGPDDVWAEILAGAWTHASTYDTARRPRRVAANLLWDTTAHVVRVVRTERAWRDHAELDDQVDVPAVHDDHVGPPVLADAVTAGVLTQLDATLVEATRLHGVALADAARLTGMSYEAAKKRRRRAEVAWLRWWAPDLCPTLPSPTPAAAEQRAA
jgi:DNA-directed RNA polymerase specialized sigma24 family protein